MDEEEKEGVCIFCGSVTSDWWHYDGRVGLVRCRQCAAQGIAETPQEKIYFENLKLKIGEFENATREKI